LKTFIVLFIVAVIIAVPVFSPSYTGIAFFLFILLILFLGGKPKEIFRQKENPGEVKKD
jgi:hypothetical protein